MKKPLIKTLVATFVAVTTMAITSAVAFAATNVYEYELSTNTNTNNFFTASSGKSNDTSRLISSDQTTVAVGDSTYTITLGNTLKMDSAGEVSFTTKGTATVYIVFAARADKTSDCSMSFDGVVYSTTSKGGGSSANTAPVVLCSEDVKAGSHIIKRGNGESYLYYIKVIDVVDDNAKTYTVTGDLSGDSALLAGKTITIGDFEATVSSDGSKYTISKTVSADPFTSASNLAASYSDEFDVTYGGSATGVTFTSSGTNTYTGTAITFTRKALGNITTGNYTTYTRPNFDLVQSNNAVIGGSSSDKYDKGSTLSFELSGPAIIVATLKNGSGTESNTASFSFLKGDTVLARTETFAGGSNEQNVNFYAPSAGTYTIQIDDSSKTACYFRQISIAYTQEMTNKCHYTDIGLITSDGTDYYLGLFVDAAKAESIENLTFGGITTDTVYNSATIGDNTFTNPNEGGYIFVVKVPNDIVTTADLGCNIMAIANILN